MPIIVLLLFCDKCLVDFGKQGKAAQYQLFRPCINISSQHLNIETGRHRNIERSQTKCILCNVQDLEDEYQFSLICPAYSNLRKVYIQNYFYVKPSMFKFVELLNSTKRKILKKYALFIIKAFKGRQSSLNANQDIT